jgi:hypothetical protein
LYFVIIQQLPENRSITVVALKIMPRPYESQATISMKTAYLTQPVADEMNALDPPN